MNRLFQFAVNHHQEISRHTIVGIMAVIIAALFPRTISFQYEFSIGRPWRYDHLIAAFDFGIYKSKEEIEEEQRKLIEEYIPYYYYDNEIKSNSLAQYTSEFSNKFHQLKKRVAKADSLQLLKIGYTALEKIYFKGIIKKDELAGRDAIYILESENIARKVALSDVYSIQEASEHLRESFANLPDPIDEWLLSVTMNALQINIIYQESINDKLIKELLSQISLTRGRIQEGELIISKGAIVTPEKYNVLHSYKSEYDKRIIGQKKSAIIWLGNMGIVLMILIILMFFLRIFSSEVYESNRKVLFIYTFITGMLIISSAIVKSGDSVLYAMPFCIVPVIMRTFFGPVTAFHVLVAMIILTALLQPSSNQIVLLHLIAGMVAIFYHIKAHYWSKFFISNGLIFATYLAGYTMMQVAAEGHFSAIVVSNYGWLSLNMLLTLLAYPLIPFFEKLFGFVSELTLHELADINKPLLKELSLKASGTFHHSLQVANLAEAAAIEIGANALLAKTGALYHDIGKLASPSYFIENQTPHANPHDQLSFEESARIIISHVAHGIELAKKHRLPDIIIDFIRTHHGTSRVEYFYQSFLKNYPPHEIDEKQFCYPGPLPYNKETAIVMMADTVEAAARSIKNPTSLILEELVEKLIDAKINQQQFANCNITFRDINNIKKVLKKNLQSIYHPRMQYPE